MHYRSVQEFGAGGEENRGPSFVTFQTTPRQLLSRYFFHNIMQINPLSLVIDLLPGSLKTAKIFQLIN